MDQNQNNENQVVEVNDQPQDVPPQLQENKVLVILKRIWPATERILKMILYAIFNFLKNSVQYIISQIKNQ
jgi:hypothetical protein